MKFLKFSVTCFLIVVSYSYQMSVFAETTATSCVSLIAPLSFGKKDTIKMKEVALLQRYLKDNGFLSDFPTGYFGKGTRKAVMTFQNTYSIEPTGIVGPMTRAKIRELSCGVSKTTQIAPASAIISTSTVTPQAQIPTQATQSTTVVTANEPSSAPYQVFVNGQRQIDASSVPKSYADQSCATVAQSNTQNTVVCKWNNKEFFSYIPTLAPVISSPPQVQEPVAQIPVTPSGSPSVVLNIGPTPMFPPVT
jgi:peptidoglycan hydrolase-like protein with peptidoglycan-binding domain